MSETYEGPCLCGCDDVGRDADPARIRTALTLLRLVEDVAEGGPMLMIHRLGAGRVAFVKGMPVQWQHEGTPEECIEAAERDGRES